MRGGFLALTMAVLLGGAGAASAQLYAPESLERYFRLEWQATHDRQGPAIEGYVYNRGAQHAERMRLVIERLDRAGQVAGSSAVWVLGTVPMGNRAYFRASEGEAPAYRVRVLSFDWTGRGGV